MGNQHKNLNISLQNFEYTHHLYAHISNKIHTKELELG